MELEAGRFEARDLSESEMSIDSTKCSASVGVFKTKLHSSGGKISHSGSTD